MRGLVAPLIKLSLFILITVVATTVLAISIANANLSSTDTYSARFTDVTSLLPGDDIRIAGVRVGQVEDVSIADRKQAEVKFSVDAGRKLPAGVTATIKFRNLVGQRYVALGQGTGTGFLSPGDTIPLERTKPALDLTELFNGFKPLFRALQPEDVNKLSYEIIQVLQGEGGTVQSLLSHTATLTSAIADKDAVIGQVITNLNTLLDTVNAHGTQLSDLIVQLQQLVSGLAADRKPIGDAIQSLSGLAGTTAGLLVQARDPLKDDIANLGTLTKSLNDNEKTVEHFLQFMPGKLTALTRTASYGSWFNFFLCSASGSVALPPLISQPISIPIAPVTQPRCQS
ncbi:MCE family protein [Actinocrispum wychmicini]|uniref:Phospholipid/cholesterol/gamma-HCH transport system substrate-binding protein n=1 Tax=Actinocrispum wychmicini TaxID=1213861 RepID=A0A4R2KFR2_9PSEU|nr:MCE family protein [Actinocrispum wychmicini]TCO65315.1 phospholipid/cholesterol/gamma-HCH transport system substrate-binding protein [Actinocrispum wychmicini]